MPIKASTIVFVTSYRILQFIRYFYLDFDRVYRKYELTGCLEGELERMQGNLQTFLEQDAVFLNETDCNLITCETRHYYLKKDFSKVMVEFTVHSRPYKLNTPKNEITLGSELERAPYPCFSAWFFPGTVLTTKCTMTSTVKENRVLLKARTGEWIGGQEKFSFQFNGSFSDCFLFAKHSLFHEDIIELS